MNRTLWLDFETRSLIDLKKHGLYNYARDPSTEVLCMAYAFDDEEVRIWIPDELFPADVMHWRGQIRAHNAGFERLIFEEVLGFTFELEQFYCTATQARANCMPGALGDVARFAGVDQKKDYRGNQLIRWLCIPDAEGNFINDPALLGELFTYCSQDVRAMRASSKAMRELSEEELHDYHVNERINDQGVFVDVPLCQAAIQYALEEKNDIEQLVQQLTGGAFSSVRSAKMREWVYERVGPEAKAMMETHKGGEKKVSIDKSVRANLLQLAEEDWDEVPAVVADVIQCADDLWSSSVAKFQRMEQLADFDDDRVRGAFVFAGGSATGRAASYGLQAHNLPRQCAEDPEAVRAAMVAGAPLVPKFGPTVASVLKGMLRPALLPAKGKVFVVADWSAIEGRVNPWLVNSRAGEAKLDQYRKGLDPYKVNAAATYGVSYDEVTKEQRQVGKVQELALGFLGGAGSFEVFKTAYGVSMSADEVTLAIKRWRKANPWAYEHGNAVEAAYMRAMRNPNHVFPACRTQYLFDGTHLWYSLPSGRILCYPFAKVDDGSVTYAKASRKPAANAAEWPRAVLWPGQAVENLTQATANDILRYALRELDDLYYDTVMHVHDEIVVETFYPEQCIADMKDIMTTAPDWAAGLPLNIEIETKTRYSK